MKPLKRKLGCLRFLATPGLFVQSVLPHQGTEHNSLSSKTGQERQLLQEKEDPDKPLTLKDLRVIPGFDYDHYRRALDDLNVEILKRIARKTYPHKFDIKVNSYDTHGNQKILSND